MLRRTAMYYEPGLSDHGLRYNPLKACVVPRPIGWIASVSQGGVINLAPFSFFNLLSYDPPYVMFSAGAHEADGGRKDTVVNVESTGEFVYSMATWAQKDQMNQTGRIVERGVDELAAAGLEPLPSRLVRPPRVKGSPVHFECRLHRIVVLPGRTPTADHQLVIGQVVAVHIDDAALTADGRVDVPRIKPIARLGYQDYAVIESVFQMAKRTPEDRVRSTRSGTT
jgi:flavin reductase (DIM6/NTAB) family NADH-FMN oxidoreductase RutF